MSTASAPIETFTLGVEEEYQIVDAETRQLTGRGANLLANAERSLGKDVQPELQTSMIEIGTPVCSTLVDVRRALRRERTAVIQAAHRNASRIAAAGTHPFSEWSEQAITPKQRYREIAGQFGQIANETVIFGCHVHVGMESRATSLAVMNRVRQQLAPILALAANSPFWLGEDTQYASYRTMVWARWPFAGPPLSFDSENEYAELIEKLRATGAIEDETKLYWDVRPSARFPTLEFRVSDVCMTVDEAVMIAGLVRAMSRTAYVASKRDEPIPSVRHEIIRASHWQAARFGTSDALIDVVSGRSVPARTVVEALLAQLRPALEEAGDFDEVSTLVEETLRRGNGAARQRDVFQRNRSLTDVVDYIVEQTESRS